MSPIAKVCIEHTRLSADFFESLFAITSMEFKKHKAPEEREIDRDQLP